jgi:hypothetical protein
VTIALPFRRTIVLSGTVLLSLPAAAGAQKLPVQFGIEAGASIANVVGENTDGSKSRTGAFGGGTVVLHKPGSVLGLQTGLLLVSKGADLNGGDLDGTLRLRYLEVPVMLRLAAPGRSSRIVPALTVGGTLGVQVGCSIAASSGGFSSSLDCNDDALGDFAQFRRFEAGLVVGGEVAIPSGQRLLIVPMVRYSRGLTNIVDAGASGNAKNSVCILGVGLRYRR